MRKNGKWDWKKATSEKEKTGICSQLKASYRKISRKRQLFVSGINDKLMWTDKWPVNLAIWEDSGLKEISLEKERAIAWIQWF